MTYGPGKRWCSFNTLVLALLAVSLGSCVGTKEGTKYVSFNEDGEPIHVHVDLSKRCPKRVCTNGGRLTEECSCKCKGHWRGSTCRKCSLVQKDCLHGGFLDEEQCQCVGCKHPWGGKLCQQCAVTKNEKCEVDEETCRCKECKRGWGGENCQTCLRDQSFCGAGSTLDQATCSCLNCPYSSMAAQVSADTKAKNAAARDQTIQTLKAGAAQVKTKSAVSANAGLTSWADAFSFLQTKTVVNPFCGKCPIENEDCEHDGVLNLQECACERCDDNWGGLKCDTCLLRESDCLHGASLDLATCTCSVNRVAPWGGALNGDCKRLPGSCWHGGSLNTDLCRCEACTSPWGGDICGTCTISDADCVHGGTACQSKCRCLKCDAPWSGPFCNKCTRTDEDCAHGGSLNAETCSCECKMPWRGDACTTCGLPVETCAEGTTLDPERCICSAASVNVTKKVMLQAEKARQALKKAMHEAKKESTSLLEEKLQPLEVDKPRRPTPGQLVVCTYTGTPDRVSGFVGTGIYFGRPRDGYYQHLFVAQECSDGKLPDPRAGEWMSTLSQSYACGEAEQWSVISPNEEDGPGVMFANRKPCKGNGAIKIRAEFFLPKKKYQNDFHRCIWQGSPERLVKPNALKNHLAGVSETMALEGWWTGKTEENVNKDEEAGKLDGNSGTILNKFKSALDPRKFADRETDESKTNGQPPSTMPGYHRHIFEQKDCTNGLPPNRPCMVSMRWGEHCGSDRDWKALHNYRGEESSVAAGVEWYTNMQCDSARVAVDYFCPEPNDEFDIGKDVHTCTYEGDGVMKSCGGGTRHANDPMEGYCRSHKFKASECGGRLPGHDENVPGRNCMAAMREFSQCGHALDFEATVVPGKVGVADTSVSWYTAGFSQTRDGDGGACSKARIVIDYMCPGECDRQCLNGGRLDKLACNCVCSAQWTGINCQHCQIEQSDCMHGSVFDPNKCTCNPAKGSVWSGPFANVCTRKQSDCHHGGVLDTKLCQCVRCDEFWAGPECSRCMRTSEMCENGATLDIGTCECSVNCPTGNWGPLCERCPKDNDGYECSNRGECEKGKCKCMSGASGDSCEIEAEEAVCKVKGPDMLVSGFSAMDAAPPVTGEYRLFSKVFANGMKESVHVIYGAVDASNYGITAVSIKSVRSTNPSGNRVTLLLRSGGVLISEDCGAGAAPRNSKEVSVGGGMFTLTHDGKLVYQIMSTNGVVVTIVDKEYPKPFGVSISVETFKKDTLKGLCGTLDAAKDRAARKRGGFMKRELITPVDSVFRCSGDAGEQSLPVLIGSPKTRQGPRAKNLRFRSSADVLLGTGSKLRFQSASNSQVEQFVDWGSAEWGSIANDDDTPLTSVSLVPKPCDSATESAAERECRKFLPAGFPAHVLKKDPVLEPYKACARVICLRADPAAAVLAAKDEIRSRKREIEEIEAKKADKALFAKEVAAAAAASKAARDAEGLSGKDADFC
jgi:hypothetical protein